MTGQRNGLRSFRERIGAAEHMPFASLDVGLRDGACAAEKLLHFRWRFCLHLLRKPEIAIRLCDVHLGVGEEPPPVWAGKSADVISVEVGDQNEVNLIRALPSAPETVRNAPQNIAAPPSAGSRIDENHSLAGVYQEGRIRGVQLMRVFAQRVHDFAQRRLISVQPMWIE